MCTLLLVFVTKIKTWNLFVLLEFRASSLETACCLFIPCCSCIIYYDGDGNVGDGDADADEDDAMLSGFVQNRPVQHLCPFTVSHTKSLYSVS